MRGKCCKRLIFQCKNIHYAISNSYHIALVKWNEMKINKDAFEVLGIFWLFLGMWDLIAIGSLLNGEVVGDIPLTIVLNAFLFYLTTESGYEKLKVVFKTGFKAAFWAIAVLLICSLIVAFFSLPPATLIIILLLMLVVK